MAQEFAAAELLRRVSLANAVKSKVVGGRGISPPGKMETCSSKAGMSERP